MHIEKLVLSGFKSFPARTVIRFHPGITAIVGPNGSGKSNIVDAILWVLGESRSTLLRARFFSDLIFKGSASRAPLSRAEVLLQLLDPPTEQALTVGRRVYSDGVNEYLLDGRVVRMKEVQDRLWEAGIESREYVVIEQGSVEALIKMKAEERRIFLEAAAGVARYRERRRESLRRIWETERDLEAVAAREAAEREYLERAEEKLRLLQEYRRIKKRLLQLQEKQIGHRLFNINRELEKKEKEREKLEALIEAESKALILLEEEEAKEGEEADELRAELARADTLLKGKSESLKQEQDRLSRLLQKKSAAEAELSSAEQRLEEQEQAEEQMAEELSQIKDKEKKAEQGFQQLSSMLRQVEAKIKELRNLAEEKRKAYLREAEALQKLKTRKQVRQSRREDLSSRRQNLAAQMAQLDKELEEGGKLPSSEPFQQELAGLEKQSEELRARLKKLKERQEELSRRLAGLRQERAAAKATLSALEKVLEKSQKGKLAESIRGDKELLRLAELLWAAEMEALPVSSPSQIEGPGTYFLPFRPQEKRTFRDELEIDEKLRPYLQDALRASSLQEALQLSLHHACPVVFPQGVVFPNNLVIIRGEKEGVLSLRAEKERTEKRLVEIEAELEAAEEELKEVEGERKETEQLLKQTARKAEELEGKLRKLSLEAARWQARRDVLLQRKAQLQEELSRIDAQLSELEAQEKEEEGTGELEGRVASLKEESDQAYRALREKEREMNRLREKLSAANERLVMLRERRERLEKELAQAERLRSELRQRLSSRREELSLLKEQIKESEKAVEALKKKVEELEAEAAKLREELRRKERSHRSLLREIERRRQELQSKREKLSEVRFALEAARKELAFLEERAREVLGKSLSSVEPVEELDEAKLEQEIEEARAEKEALGEVDLNAEREYQQAKESLERLLAQKEDLLRSIENLKKIIRKLDQEYNRRMEQTLEKLNSSFQQLFESVFGGGQVKVSFVGEEKGLEIDVSLPGRRKQPLHMLSGGEKALVSLLFHIALFKINPAPFLVLDEVDAPLDNTNLSKLLRLLNSLKQDTQIIIITHNPMTIKNADYVFGVSMAEPGVSRVYSVEASKLFGEKNV